MFEKIIVYADGPMPSATCLECGYLDLQRLPTYISPKTTQKIDNERRRLPDGEVLPMTRQAGVIDAEGATGGLPSVLTEHSASPASQT